MISLLSQTVKFLLRIYTFPYRIKHKSLSRSVKFKEKIYQPPKDMEYAVSFHKGVKIERLSPRMEDSDIVVVQFHGGGHTQKMNALYRNVAEIIVKNTRCSVFSIDYNVGRDKVYPSVSDECYNAYAYLSQGLLKDKRIVTIGDSYGANFMLFTCLKTRDNAEKMPCGIVAISCFIDLSASGVSYKNNCYKDPMYSLPRWQKFEKYENKVRKASPYCGNTPPCYPLLSPAFAEYAGFPNTLIQCGDTETSLSDNEMLYDAMKKENVRVRLTKYKGMWHDFQYIFPFLKESKKAWKEICDFIIFQKNTR